MRTEHFLARIFSSVCALDSVPIQQMKAPWRIALSLALLCFAGLCAAQGTTTSAPAYDFVSAPVFNMFLSVAATDVLGFLQ